jgi:hypothetical protein
MIPTGCHHSGLLPPRFKFIFWDLAYFVIGKKTAQGFVLGMCR